MRSRSRPVSKSQFREAGYVTVALRRFRPVVPSTFPSFSFTCRFCSVCSFQMAIVYVYCSVDCLLLCIYTRPCLYCAISSCFTLSISSWGWMGQKTVRAVREIDLPQAHGWMAKLSRAILNMSSLITAHGQSNPLGQQHASSHTGTSRRSQFQCFIASICTDQTAANFTASDTPSAQDQVSQERDEGHWLLLTASREYIWD
jgi:hypothetical protein